MKWPGPATFLYLCISRPEQPEGEPTVVVVVETATTAAVTRPSLLNRLSSSRRRPASTNGAVSAANGADTRPAEPVEAKPEYVIVIIYFLYMYIWTLTIYTKSFNNLARAEFVRQKRGKKLPSFIKQKVASSSTFLCLTNPAQFKYSGTCMSFRIDIL
jgi:hypothetical protein